MKKSRFLIALTSFLMLASLSGCSSGRSVSSCYINEDGDLVIVYSDGSEEDVGKVKGQNGTDGSDGQDGKDGSNGANGQDGKDGTSLLTGHGEPSSELGKDGDAYIDLDTWEFYLKIDGTWVDQGCLKSGGSKIVSIEAVKAAFPYATPFSETGLSVIAHYQDGTTAYLPSSAFTFGDGEDFTYQAPGKYETTVTCKYDSTITADYSYTIVPRSSLKVLFIGNSFSDDTVTYMPQAANSLGISLDVTNAYIGGCSIDQHYSYLQNDTANYQLWEYSGLTYTSGTNLTLKSILAEKDWDIISIQQVSGYSGVSSSYANVYQYMDLIRENIQDPDHTRFAWNMTWAYQTGSTHSDFPKYNSDQMTMYNAILSCVQALNREEIKLVIPNGTAMQNLRTSYIGDDVTRDGYHLNTSYARYTAALTALKELTGADIDDIRYSPTLTKGQKLASIEAADNAFLHPYEITSSVYTEDPSTFVFHEENYNRMDLDIHVGRYYVSTESGGSNYQNYQWVNYNCTDIFTKDDLPTGSVIYVESGYQYRPEGWIDTATPISPRPGVITTTYVEVDEDWWGNYNYRAFNISKTDSTAMSDSETDLNAFRIYLPK